MIQIYSAVEDRLSAEVLNKLIGETQGQLEIAVTIPPAGAGKLKMKLPELIRLAPHVPVLLLTDLDRRECAPGLVADWLGQLPKPDSLLFRVAVREVEAWLLADRDNFSAFTRVPRTKLSQMPESLEDPKKTLLNLVMRYSPLELKREIVTDHGGGPTQGFAYNERLAEFVRNSWNPAQAAARADSLARTRRRIDELTRLR